MLRISMIVNNKEVKNFDVRLAIHKVDYFVPVDLSDYSGKLISFKFKNELQRPGACQPFAGQHCLLQGNEIVRHVRHKQS